MTATQPNESFPQGATPSTTQPWADDTGNSLEGLDSLNFGESIADPEGSIDLDQLQDIVSTDVNGLETNIPLITTPAPTPQHLEVLFTRKTLALARQLGYALLAMTIVDLLYILLPIQFMNPVWEYQVIGDIVKLIPLPILALFLIFAGEKNYRKRQEIFILKSLSYTTLVIGVLFFLLLPLIAIDSFRINRFNNLQITTEVEQQKTKLNATQKQLNQMDSQQLMNLIPAPDKSGSLGVVPSSPAEAKQSIIANLERAKANAEDQANQARKNVGNNLAKNTIKLFVESLISGLIFWGLWLSTEWARPKELEKKPKSVKPSKIKKVSKI